MSVLHQGEYEQELSERKQTIISVHILKIANNALKSSKILIGPMQEWRNLSQVRVLIHFIIIQCMIQDARQVYFCIFGLFEKK